MTTFKYKKFIKDLQSISLSTDEKAELRADFLQKTGLPDYSNVSVLSSFFMVRYTKILVYSLLIFVTAIIPFTFAAEYSQPGDVLYPLKISFNEPIKKAVEYISRPDKHIQKEDQEPQTKSNTESDEHNKNNPQLNSKKSDFSFSKKNNPTKKITDEGTVPILKNIDSQTPDNQTEKKTK